MIKVLCRICRVAMLNGTTSNIAVACLSKVYSHIAGIILKFSICYLTSRQHNRNDKDYIRKLSRKLTRNIHNPKDAMETLCKFVIAEVDFFLLDEWLQPAGVIRIGLGDCKNMCILLRDLLKERGINAEIKVGFVKKRGTFPPKCHTWVEIRDEDHIFICDPTVSYKAMKLEDYKDILNDFTEVTEEYQRLYARDIP